MWITCVAEENCCLCDHTQKACASWHVVYGWRMKPAILEVHALFPSPEKIFRLDLRISRAYVCSLAALRVSRPLERAPLN